MGLNMITHFKVSNMLRKIALLVFSVAVVTAYNPDTQNVYHLFTRSNPTVSQPFLLGQNNQLLNSNFNPSLPTVLLVHGFLGSATSEINTVLTPAYLQSANVNVIVVDWSAGAQTLQASVHAISSGMSVAAFINWIREVTGLSLNNITLVAHSLGCHMVGVTGRNINGGRIPYIVALDPGAGMDDSGHLFGTNAATYTEAIHTNAEVMGHGLPLAHADFYPNGGDIMPGCGINFVCSHLRAIFYFGETLTTTGGFMSRSCATYTQARLGMCLGAQNTRMGGHNPKTGTSGLFHLTTNAQPPFSVS